WHYRGRGSSRSSRLPSRSCLTSWSELQNIVVQHLKLHKLSRAREAQRLVETIGNHQVVDAAAHCDCFRFRQCLRLSCTTDAYPAIALRNRIDVRCLCQS